MRSLLKKRWDYIYMTWLDSITMALRKGKLQMLHEKLSILRFSGNVGIIFLKSDTEWLNT